MLICGFFFNRVVFNIGILFASLYIISHKNWWSYFKNDGYLASFLLIPLTVLVADLIHSPELIQKTTFFNKMSLVAIPLFLYMWKRSEKLTKFTHWLLYTFLLCNTFYSLGNYFLNPGLVEEGYKFAKVMPVLSFKDHIRISWLVSLSIVLCIYDIKYAKGKFEKIMLGVYVLIQVLYIHLLSAKTGLLCLYLSIFILIIYWIARTKNRTLAVFTLMGLFLLPFLAYQTVPSFKTRIGYIRWDVVTALRGSEQPGLSDGARIYSLQSGFEQFTNHPIAGSGFIEIKANTDAWYAIHKPFILEAQKILPSSELLIFSIGAGILGLLLLILHFSLPFFQRGLWRNGFFPSIYIPALVTFLYETHFEGQTTLYVYAFWVFWAYLLFNNKTLEVQKAL